MAGVCRHAPDPEKNQGFQRADIRICVPQAVHIKIFVSAAGRGAGKAIGNQALFFRLDPGDQGGNGVIAEIYVGHSGKQALQHQPVGVCAEPVFIAFRGPGKADERAGEPVLKNGGIRLFAAYARAAGAGGAAGSLFTLKTKHMFLHVLSSSIQKFSIRGNDRGFPGDRLAACLKRLFGGRYQAAAARYFHSDYR